MQTKQKSVLWVLKYTDLQPIVFNITIFIVIMSPSYRRRNNYNIASAILVAILDYGTWQES